MNKREENLLSEKTEGSAEPEENLVKDFIEFYPKATHEDVEKFRAIVGNLRKIIEVNPGANENKDYYPERQLKIDENWVAKDFLLDEQIESMRDDSHESFSSLGRHELSPNVIENILSFCGGRELIKLSQCSKTTYSLVNRRCVWENLCRNDWRVLFRLDTFIVGKNRKFFTPEHAPSSFWKVLDDNKVYVVDDIGYDYTLDDLKETYFRHEEANVFICIPMTLQIIETPIEVARREFIENLSKENERVLQEACQQYGVELSLPREEKLNKVADAFTLQLEADADRLQWAQRKIDDDLTKLHYQLEKMNQMAELDEDSSDTWLRYAKQNRHVYLSNSYEIGFFIQHANDGDLFIFRSGVHNIPLHFFSIDASITIIGDCIESNDVVIEDDETNFHDFGIELKLPLNVAARFCNLRIIHKGGNEGCICVRGGHLYLEGCEIECKSGIRIMSHMSAFIFNSTIHSSYVYGIEIESATAALQQVTVTNCCRYPNEEGEPAISISGKSNVMIKRCAIKKNKGHGIGLYKDNIPTRDPVSAYFQELARRVEENRELKIEFDKSEVEENEYCQYCKCTNVNHVPCIISYTE